MTQNIRRVAVFCGASVGNKPEYINLAKSLAQALVSEKISLVYGGCSVGLMGVLGSEVMRLGGEAIGVVPEHLSIREVSDPNISKLHIVSSMQERKKLMSELADGFIMLPGGIGTLDEFFEEMTAVQLGQHRKPCGILNVENYFDSLLHFLRTAVAANFYSGQFCDYIVVEQQPEKLLQRFYQYQAPKHARWELELQPATS